MSVNVGRSRTLTFGKQTFKSGIVKAPVAGAVTLRAESADGDEQADLKNHGGRDRAVYAYALEDYAWWSNELGRALRSGDFGENLTVEGIAVNDAIVGERWEIGGEVELEVSTPRIPCYKLAAKMNDPQFVARFGRALRLGPYLRVVREGSVRAGDAIAVTHRPAHGIRIVDVGRIYLFARDELTTLLTAPELGAQWLAWISEQVEARAGKPS